MRYNHLGIGQEGRFRLHAGEFTDFEVHARYFERQPCSDPSQKRKKIEPFIEEEEFEDEIIKASTVIDEFTISRKTAHGIFSKIKTAPVHKTPDPTMSINSSPTKPKDNLKLPRIELPKISGQPPEWIAFAELFVGAVHDQSSLSDCQKKQYLKTSFRDEALKTIFHCRSPTPIAKQPGTCL